MQNLAPSNETENVYCLYKAQHRISLEFYNTHSSPAVANDMKDLWDLSIIFSGLL